MIAIKLIPKKKGGKKWPRIPAVFVETDGWVEARPPRGYPMAKFLKREQLPDFLAGKKVDFSYTYFIQLLEK